MLPSQASRNGAAAIENDAQTVKVAREELFGKESDAEQGRGRFVFTMRGGGV